MADVFKTSWNSVYRAVTVVVLWGIAQRSLDGVKAIDIDEVRELLDALASGAAGSRVTIEAQAAVRRLTR